MNTPWDDLAALAAAPGGTDPRWQKLQADYCRQQSQLWLNLLAAVSGQPCPPVIEPAQGDQRFSAPEWNELPYFDYLKQSYLLNCRWLEETMKAADLDAAARRKALFVARQVADALSPANFLATNPEALKLALETESASIADGTRLFLADLAKGRIAMTDERAFEVGTDLAGTPGAVVFQNEVMQLIQYAPLTAQAHRRPLLIVPPFINKYYILDLQPHNSFVRHAVAQGLTVFMVSWRNIPPGSAEPVNAATWDDYIELGVCQPLAAALAISGADKANALGFCIGGTLLATALAVVRKRSRTIPVTSLTLLATMLDFSDVGEIGVYVDAASVQKCEADFASGGAVNGRELAFAFASLRANELVWRYVVNSYLKGKPPEAFDLLYWNSDSANLPGKLHAYYLRNMYLENNLRVPGKLSLCGAAVDLGRINLPTYLLASREDHIVPWQTAYASTRLLKGRLEFVLAASGHIAGVVNPASANRRNYWINEILAANPEQWLAAAQAVPGSWWPHWSAWLKQRSGRRVPARERLGSTDYPPGEAAPGSYVKVRHDQTRAG